MTGRQGRRRRKILDDLKERRGYCHLNEEALDRTVDSSLWKRLWTCRKTWTKLKATFATTTTIKQNETS